MLKAPQDPISKQYSITSQSSGRSEVQFQIKTIVRKAFKNGANNYSTVKSQAICVELTRRVSTFIHLLQICCDHDLQLEYQNSD